jgi:transposase InsO family protein
MVPLDEFMPTCVPKVGAVGKKRIARLMRAAGIVGVSRRRGVITTRWDRDARPAPDLVDRNFAADRPNQLWVADITLSRRRSDQENRRF